tara:strand:+ start:561 stop:2240 length:1680 start_codon:yes stop_codon:yes gene_type:complete
MADFDPNTITLRELARVYSEEQELKSPISMSKAIFGKYLDEPAIAFFAETEGEASLARQTLKDSKGKVSAGSMKTALKNLRYLSNRLYNAYDASPPPFLVSNEKNTPKVAQEFFGVKEPPKAVSSLQVATDEKTVQKFYDKLMQYASDNPDKLPHVRAIVFGMNTGFRPNANLRIQVGQYKPENGAIYIPAQQTGAKGRAISVPLNRTADSMLQQQFSANREHMVDNKSVLFVDNDGKPLTTKAVNAVLEEIKVPELVFDEKTGEYFDSLKPVGADSSKFGMSLFRNYHTTRAGEVGIDDGILSSLQGRTLTTTGRSKATGELYTYRSSFPFRVSPEARKNADLLADDSDIYINNAIEKVRQGGNQEFTFDHGASTDVVQTRTTRFDDAEGNNYFARPATELEVDPEVVVGTPDKKAVSDSSRAEWVKKLKQLGSTGLKGLGAFAFISAGEEAYAEEKKAGGSEARALTAGAIRGAYELFETPLLMGVTAPKLGGGKDEMPVSPQEQTKMDTIQEQLTRVKQYDERESQLKRVEKYDERMALDRQMSDLQSNTDVTYPQ